MNMTRPLQTATLKVETAVVLIYAELTDDFNPIHVDPVFAASTPMGGVIAHGTMSICLLWQAIFRSFAAEDLVNPHLDVRFLAPVREGETLTAGLTPTPGDMDLYDVWVQSDDGGNRVAGTLRLSARTTNIV
jgi:3-hydroxybutyryl-CoA dehydratase